MLVIAFPAVAASAERPIDAAATHCECSLVVRAMPQGLASGIAATYASFQTSVGLGPGLAALTIVQVLQLTSSNRSASSNSHSLGLCSAFLHMILSQG